MSLLKYFKKSPAPSKKKEKEELDTKLGDVVWAKLPDFPWWPGMICEDPSSGKVFKNDEEVHIQFFGEPPTRDWVVKK